MPGTHSPISRHLFTLDGMVLTSGGAKNLAKGQFTIVNSGKAGANGAVVINSFTGEPDSTVYEMRLGKSKFPATRTALNSKPYSSQTFKIKDVVSVKANFPRFNEQKFDDLIIGYDGINADTAITLEENMTTVLDVVLSGDHIMFKTGQKQHVIKLHFGREVGETNEEVIRKVAKRLSEYTLAGDTPVTEFIKVSVVDSDNAALTGTAYLFSNLTLTDNGDSNSLAKVQAQYPLYDVKLTARNGLQSVYTILHPTASTLAAYVQTTAATYIKNCEDCGTGYTEITGGVAYSVTIEDDGVDLSTTVDNLPGFVTGSVIRQGVRDGKGLYTIVLDNDLTPAEITTYVTTAGVQTTATIERLGLVADVCSDVDTVNVAWVAGDTCFAATQTYRIQLRDNECGESRLAELQAAYPELTITESTTPTPVAGGCQRIYQAPVVTNVACDECSDIFVDQFTSEAPADFDFSSWELVEPAADEDALMGIRITGKPFIFYPTEATRDEVPFYETSTRVSVAGGYIEEVNQSFDPFFSDIFSIKRLSRAQDRDNLGGNLMQWEDVSRTYFDGSARHVGNQFAKGVLQEESVLKYSAQYVSYEITLHEGKYSQGLGRTSDSGISYIIHAELGFHQPLEAYINKLAARAGVAAVNPV